jgi:hypothetical protein
MDGCITRVGNAGLMNLEGNTFPPLLSHDPPRPRPRPNEHCASPVTAGDGDLVTYL